MTNTTQDHYLNVDIRNKKDESHKNQSKVMHRNSESKPINTSNSTAGIDNYGSILPIEIPRFRKLTKCDILIFFLIFWNIYSTRKLLFPFSEEFSAFYHTPIQSFSYILASYDLGGVFTIFLTIFSFNKIRINLMLFLLIITVSILYIFISLSDTFLTLFIIRIIIGFVCQFGQSQIRAIITSFLKKNENNPNVISDIENDIDSTDMSKALIFCECGWWSSTISWAIVGIILNYLNVNYVWYYVAFCALITSLLCFLLPKCNLSDVSLARSQMQMTKDTETGINNINNISIWKHYHIYFLFLAFFLVACGYNSYLACFGAWMTERFDLNPERLGFSTLVITASECTGFLSILFLQRYKIRNINISIICNLGGLLTILVWVLVLMLNVYNELMIWIIVFVYTVFFEHVYLSLIVVNLEMAPKGFETTISLIYGSCNRLSAVIGIISGPHIVNWFSFEFMMQIIVVIQCCAFICVCISNWLWKRHNK